MSRTFQGLDERVIAKIEKTRKRIELVHRVIALVMILGLVVIVCGAIRLAPTLNRIAGKLDKEIMEWADKP
jgi:hypothetical protein